MPDAYQKSRLILLGLLLMAFLGLFLYSNIIYSPFVYDDYSSIVENESVRSISETLRNVANNRYLTSFSFSINYGLDGLRPLGYHIINNLIHVINAILVCSLLIYTFRTPFLTSCLTPHARQYFIAFSAAFVFVAHPIQTQAVTYISQRATSLATMFYLLSLVTYIKFRTFKLARWYAPSIIFALFAMKTKEIAFTLPVIIALYEFAFFKDADNVEQKGRRWKRVVYIVPFLLTMLIIPLGMLDIKGPVKAITQGIDVQSRETVNIARIDYLFTQFRVIVTYLRLLILPLNQNFDYDYPLFSSFFIPQVFSSFFLLLLLLSFSIYLFYKSHTHGILRLAAFGFFWFFITLSVESSIIPIRDVISEHRLYLPSIGFFFASITLIEVFFVSKKIKIPLMVIIVLLFSIGTYSRNMVWQDTQRLWEDVIAKSPNNSRAYNNLGVIFKNSGELDRAIEYFEKSLTMTRNYTAAYFNLGDVQYRLRNYENAIVYLKQALQGKRDRQLSLDILNKLGRAYSAKGDTDNAIETFREAIKVSPSAVAPYNNLGVQYVKKGEYDLAIEVFQKALKIKEEPYLRSNLTIAYNMKNEKEKNVKETKK